MSSLPLSTRTPSQAQPATKSATESAPEPAAPVRRKRVAFVTIGQAPRDDMLPEILAHLPSLPDHQEFGALDDLALDEIAALAPKLGQERLVTRLRDGREVVIAKPAMQRLLAALLARLDGEGFDLVVLLCTGHFEPFATTTPLLEAQLVVDHFTQGLTYGIRRIGVLVPDAAQRAEFHGIPGKEIITANASPYGDRRFALAARELGRADAVVMHCMGYDAAMREELAQGLDCPVILSRRLVAAAVELMLE